MRLPTNDDPYSLKPTHHYDPSATMQNPTNSLPIGLGILKYQQMYKILMTLPSLLIYQSGFHTEFVFNTTNKSN